jgi:hypothetical protein
MGAGAWFVRQRTELASPTCEHCGVRTVTHGLEMGGRMFCCDRCAEMSGIAELRDRA